MRILLVEDDELLGDGLCKGLKQAGHRVDWLKEGDSAISVMKTEQYAVIVLDIGLPKVSGLEVLRTIRRSGVTTPVLILTALDAVEDRVKGLDSGADDYLTKPCDLDELCARVRALHRRYEKRVNPIVSYRNLTLDPAALTVKVDGEIVSIPRREFTLLLKMLENAGTVMPREVLMRTLYGWEDEVDSNALEVHIHNLRKKLNADFIKTLRGIGYMIEKENPDKANK